MMAYDAFSRTLEKIMIVADHDDVYRRKKQQRRRRRIKQKRSTIQKKIKITFPGSPRKEKEEDDLFHDDVYRRRMIS